MINLNWPSFIHRPFSQTIAAMKYLPFFLLLFLTPFLSAQSEEPTPDTEKYAEDVASLDNILTALYASISGERGEARDWDRFRYLFTKEARLIPTGKNKEGEVSYRIMSPQEYVDGSGVWLEENGFFELEIHREVAAYGSLVHAFSTYESYRSKSDETPFARGINSIQLLNDGNRWWVMHIYWLAEREELPLPAKYLPKN